MRLGRPVPRMLGLAALLALAVVAAIAFYSTRRDIETLQEVSQNNHLWAATQTEIELLRFERSLSEFAMDGTEETVASVRKRFELLWSRLEPMQAGRAGLSLERYDEGYNAIGRLAEHLDRIEPVVMSLRPGDGATARQLIDGLESYRDSTHRYTLRAVRADTQEATALRERILLSSQLTGLISLGAIVICVFTLVLIMRDNARQRQMVEISRQSAEAAEAASRAKSRFLTMMSHEMRNPLNGVLGPLALLEQSELPRHQQRLVAQAQQSGRAVLAMLGSLLEWGEMQDNRLVLKREPFGLDALAGKIAGAINGPGKDAPAKLEVTVRSDGSEFLYGDVDRLEQVFTHLVEYVAPDDPNSRATLDLFFENGSLVGDIGFNNADGSMAWKLDLLTGMSEARSQPFSTDLLGPMIARGLIAAAQGLLLLGGTSGDRGRIRVSIPAERVQFEKIRVHLETRSSALAAIYRAALNSDRIEFSSDNVSSADIVLVDSTSIHEEPLMQRLRARFPDALFVSLGLPGMPGFFDDVVETPYDMARLRKSIFGRLAS